MTLNLNVELTLRLSKESKRLLATINNITKTSKLLGLQKGTPDCVQLVSDFNKISRSCGIRFSIKHSKALFSEAVRFSCGLSVVPQTPMWVKRDKDLFPIQLGLLKGMLRGSVLERRIALSYLRAYEILELEPVPDLDTVVSPSSGKIGFQQILVPWENFLRTSRFAASIKENLLSKIDEMKKVKRRHVSLHFSTKKGVKGPTCTTAGLQSLAIKGDLKENIIKLREIFVTEDFRSILEYNQEYHTKSQKDITFRKDTLKASSTRLGRITFIPDKGGKTRLVAIGNYWIQDCLSKLHKGVYRVLRDLPCDGTYTQESQFERVRRNSQIRPVWSYDLTAATDRFPVEPQISVLKHLHNELGSLWESILKDLSFMYDGVDYKYAVGQPMGLYGSWAVFALTHHFVVQYCAFQEGYNTFDKYSILGDDIAIWDRGVARRYKEILTALDVSISESKSFIPVNPRSGPCVSEFAKRISDRGIEISPLSPKQNNEAWNSYWNWPCFADWLQSHNFSVGTIPVSRVSSLGNLKVSQTTNLSCALYIWGLHKASTLLIDSGEVIGGVPESFKVFCTKGRVLVLRLDALMEHASHLGCKLGDDREALETRLGGSITDSHYFIQILKQRLEEMWNAVTRLNQGLRQPQNEEEEDDLAAWGYQWQLLGDAVLPPMSDLEYIPDIAFDELINGITSHDPHRVMKSTYIQLLLKKAKEWKTETLDDPYFEALLRNKD